MYSTNIPLLIIAVLLLFYSGGILVRALTWMGRYLQLSEYALSFILVAFATSLPELFVGINSAFRGAPELSLGNLIGANVLNIAFVLGLAVVLVRKFTMDNPVTAEDIQVTFALSILPVLLMFDGIISRADGFILLFLFAGYVSYLLKQNHYTPKVNNTDAAEFTFRNFMRKFFVFILGAGLLIASSSFVVSFGISTAQAFGVPLFILGIMIAIGTTLPEVVFSLRSIVLHHSGMSLGNVLGSIIINMSFILGIVAVIHPIVVSDVTRAILSILLTVGLVVLIQAVVFARQALERGMGIFLLAVAIIFLVSQAVLY